MTTYQDHYRTSCCSKGIVCPSARHMTVSVAVSLGMLPQKLSLGLLFSLTPQGRELVSRSDHFHLGSLIPRCVTAEHRFLFCDEAHSKPIPKVQTARHRRPSVNRQETVYLSLSDWKSNQADKRKSKHRRLSLQASP